MSLLIHLPRFDPVMFCSILRKFFLQIDEEDSESEDSDVFSELSQKVKLQKRRDMARTQLNERRTTLRSAVAPGMNVTVDRPKTKKLVSFGFVTGSRWYVFDCISNNYESRIAIMSAVQTMSRTQMHRGKRSNAPSAATSTHNLNQASFQNHIGGSFRVEHLVLESTALECSFWSRVEPDKTATLHMFNHRKVLQSKMWFKLNRSTLD